MAKISKQTINNLKEFMDRGCEYSGTQDIVNDLMNESLREMGAKIIHTDDVILTDWYEDPIGMLDDFANIFWDKAVEKILNVLKTEEYRMSDRYLCKAKRTDNGKWWKKVQNVKSKKP